MSTFGCPEALMLLVGPDSVPAMPTEFPCTEASIFSVVAGDWEFDQNRCNVSVEDGGLD
jgi:hypothetical protein